MVTLDELKQISDMTPLERSFYVKLEEAKKVALTTNQRSIELNVMKRSFFTDQLAHFVKGPINPDELYQSQIDLVNKFKDAGFTMTEEEPSPVIIASVNEDPKDSAQREFEQKYLEKKVIAAW
jgi:hypothetical protein